MKRAAAAIALITAAVLISSAVYTGEKSEPVPVQLAPCAGEASAEPAAAGEKKNVDHSPWLLAGVLFVFGLVVERTVKRLEEG